MVAFRRSHSGPVWFDTEEDFKAVFGWTTISATRADTLKHVSRQARMIVRENLIEVRNA